LLSLMIFIVTSIPMHMGGFYSDGARILRLQRGGDKARFDVLTLTIITSSVGGTRPKLLNISELEEALALANKLNEPFGVYLLSYFHQAAFDEGDNEKAKKYLLEYISLADAIPAGIRNAVWLDAALFYAIAKNDLEKATLYWNQFKPTAIIPTAQIFTVEAAMSYLKNDRIEAEQKIESAIKELPNMLDKGVAIALGERLLILKNNLNK
jgi:tetratricopeptide (TPR) repeat protein